MAGGAILAAFAALLLLFRPGTAYTSDHLGNVEKLLPERTTVCWHDADRLDDLVLNARGKVTFIYMDGKLARALAQLREEQMKSGPAPEIPPQMLAYSRKYNSRKKHVVFVARVDALKMWEFDAEKISVGGHTPSEKDIIKDVQADFSVGSRHGTTELPKGYHGYIGFFVPAENVKPGTKIKLSYGEDIAEWLVP
jgi:hypothetical protein